ncbi:MAG: VC_2705 family sodium/solute symporter [Alphaproteobacteria bacterium]
MASFQHPRRSTGRNFRRATTTFSAAAVAFVALALVMEIVGVSPRVGTYLLVGASLAVFVVIAVMARTLQVAEFYVAGRNVPAVFNGMALAASGVGGAMIASLAGILYYGGFAGLVFLIGWTGGLVLLAVLVAPYLRKFGAYTVPDYLAARFGGSLARLVGIGVLFAASAVFLVALFDLGAVIVARLLGTQFETGIAVVLAVVVASSVLGGMRAVTRIQIVQYIILALALFIPGSLILIEMAGVPIAQSLMAPALENLPALAPSQDLLVLETAEFFGATIPDPLNAFALIFCLALGTASLPHILMRTFTSTNVSETRRTAGWGIFFMAAIFAILPVFAGLAKYSVLNEVVGHGLADLPQWVGHWVSLGLVQVVDTNGDGVVGWPEFFMAPEVVLLASPEIAGLPRFFSGLLGVGVFSAILATASGLLLALANAVSHDFYYRIVDPLASTARRLVIGRVLLIVVAVLAAWAASQRQVDILTMMAWSFSLAASGNFSALVLGIWWKRCTRQGAVVGMITGLGVASAYLLGTHFGGWTLWFGVAPVAAGLFGVPASFAAIIVVSVMTRAPDAAISALVDDIRTPSGESYTERERLEERAREAGLGQ